MVLFLLLRLHLPWKTIPPPPTALDGDNEIVSARSPPTDSPAEACKLSGGQSYPIPPEPAASTGVYGLFLSSGVQGGPTVPIDGRTIRECDDIPPNATLEGELTFANHVECADKLRVRQHNYLYVGCI